MPEHSASLELSQSWLEQSKLPGYKIEKLNALSAPKGTQFTCELTSAPARVCLVTPLLTLYFATRQDAILSWEGILYRLLPLLAPLRQKPAIIGSEEERTRRVYAIQLGKRALVDLARSVAQKNLVQGKFDLAIPGAMQSLNNSKDIYGQDAAEIVPAYLLLAEAYLGRGQFREAQEYLSLANWSVLKHHDQCSNAIRSQLHRNFGRLYASQNKFKEALSELAKDIYYTSVEKGPEHINTAGGYYHMGKVFEAQNKMESALPFYAKVVEIWTQFLSESRLSGETLSESVKTASNEKPVVAQLDSSTHMSTAAAAADTYAVSDAQLVEAYEMLNNVLSVEERYVGDVTEGTGQAKYALGLLQLLTKDNDSAHIFLAEAYEVYTSVHGPQHALTQEVLKVLQRANAGIGAGGATPESKA